MESNTWRSHWQAMRLRDQRARRIQLLGAPSSKSRIQDLQQCSAVLDPFFISDVGRNDSGNHALDARRFVATKLAILAVDVMDDFADLTQTGVAGDERRDERLECACVSDVSVLGLEHVK